MKVKLHYYIYYMSESTKELQYREMQEDLIQRGLRRITTYRPKRLERIKQLDNQLLEVKKDCEGYWLDNMFLFGWAEEYTFGDFKKGYWLEELKETE